MIEDIRLWTEQTVLGLGATTSGAVYITDATLVVLTLLLSWLSFTVCHKLVVPLTMRITEKTDADWDDVLLNGRTLRKACLIVPAIVVSMFIPDIFHRMPDIMEMLERLTSIYITVMSTRLALEVINSLKMLDPDMQSARHQYLHTFCGVLKIVALFLAVIVVVAIVVNRNPLTLLAGLGATSAILMLVFKDTISGLVAGIRLTSNDMLHKGDWITVDKAGINGVVEEITLTIVKVRNFDNTIVTITPQTLVDDSFQNWKSMQEGDGRRVNRRIFIDVHTIRLVDDDTLQRLRDKGYIDTTDKPHDADITQPADKPLLRTSELTPHTVNLSLFRLWADRYLANHPDINPDMLYMVRQLESTPTGLPVEFYFFLREKQWKPFENQKDCIIERLLAAVGDFGMSIYQIKGDK